MNGTIRYAYGAILFRYFVGKIATTIISDFCYYCVMPSYRSPKQKAIVVQPTKMKWYKRTSVNIAVMLLVPPVGLFTMWLFLPWKKYIKLLITLPLLFTSAVFLLTCVILVQDVNRQNAKVEEEKTKIERFLKEKYSKQFTVKNAKIVQRGDVLFGVAFREYQANVSPVDDLSIVFTAGRIVSGQSLDGGANDPDKYNYHDGYLQELWERELKERVESAIHREPTDVFDINYSVSITVSQKTKVEFYDAIWATVPTYAELPANQKKRITHIAKIKSYGTVDASNIISHANTMRAVKQAVNSNDESLRVVVEYEVYRDKKDQNPRWEWQGNGRVSPGEATSAEELIPYFIEWRDGRGLYYNPNAKQFNLQQPSNE